MISRRILRVKVMQVLYSHYIGGSDLSSLKQEGMLLGRIQKTKQLYFVYLQYLIEICHYALVDATKRSNKYILKDEDKDINTDLAKNSIILQLIANEAYPGIQKTHGTMGFIDKKLVKTMFKQLRDSAKYVKYCEIDNKTQADHIEILRYITKKILGASEALDEFLSEHFMNLEDDHFICLHSIQKILKDNADQSAEDFVKAILLLEDDSEDVEFSKDLLSNCLDKDEELDEIIKPKLKNWDLDRIALMDIVLIKQAIAEFLYFPYVPLKVSMNEYIDISKEYSTEKSKDFINGILDKVMKDLSDKGKIKKLGRGLINN
ncbi:MAG: transcription antitermination factor NusB [Chitinophagales bacterium]|nr:transcription antitermination factor NusB [Chitinophagales bacterium]